MKKRILTAALLLSGLAFTAGTASADWGTAPVPGYGQQQQPTAPVSTVGQYGWNPIFKKVLWWKKDGCDGGACGGKGCADKGPPAPGSGLPGSPGASMPGTLVFPNHPYIRSPRDYFMYGQGGN